MAFQKGHPPMGGRPKGATTKPRFSDYVTEDQVKKMISKAIEMAGEGNETMLKFCLEQHLGKAMQPVEGDFKTSLNITFDNAFTSETKTDSE